jgi:hypothetical protein
MDRRTGSAYPGLEKRRGDAEGGDGRKVMKEQEWLACDDPDVLLRDLSGKLQNQRSRYRVDWLAFGKGTLDRKFRLFACACWRRAWSHLPDERHRQAVEVAERYADGLATRDELRRVTDAEWAVFRATQPTRRYEAHDASWAASRVAEEVVRFAFPDQRNDHDQHPAAHVLRSAESSAQADLLRDPFGNPFHPVSLTPALMTPDVLKLAQGAYENRLLPSGVLDNSSLAILADALEEAGSDDTELLGHLRGLGPHVRGCHVVDLLTERG